MDPITIAAIIAGIVGLVGTGASIYSTNKTNKMMLEQKEEDKEYNSPLQESIRLRQAGMSPALMGLDSVDTSSPVQLGSNSEALLNAGRQLSDTISGWSGQYLEQKRVQNDINKTESDIQHQENVDNLDLMKFNLDSIKSSYDFRKMDDEHLSNLIKTSDDLSSLAFQSALTGRMPVGLDSDTQSKFDEALKQVNTNSTEFKLAKSAMDKGVSENELNKLLAEQERKFRESNPLDETLKYDEDYKRAMQTLNVSHAGLVNEGIAQDNAYESLAKPEELALLHNQQRVSNERYWNARTAKKKLLQDISSIEDELNSMTWLQYHGKYASQRRAQLARFQAAYDQLTTGVTVDNSTPIPYLSEYGKQSGQVGSAVGNLAGALLK